MLRYLIILFVCIYLFGIISNIFNIVESSSLLDTLETYLSSAEFSHYTHFVIHKDYHSSLSTLLFRYPRIHHHLGFSCPDLSYGNADNVNYSNATRIYNDLLMQRNYYISGLPHSMNPLTALQRLIRIPSVIVNGLGFSLSSKSFKFINLLGWCIAYFLDMYSDEIKIFINSFFK